MKEFKYPELDVRAIDVEDVITTSNDGGLGDTETSPDEF